MPQIVKDLLSSKKFMATIGAALAVLIVKLAGRAGIALDEATAASIADRITALGLAYLVAQGAADHGKEAAQINAVSDVKTAMIGASKAP